MSLTKTILEHARALIDTPDKWTQNAFARNALGVNVEVRGSSATCFCTLGAIERAVDRMNDDDGHLMTAAGYARRLLANSTGAEPLFYASHLAEFNDRPTTTHAIVMEMFDKAIDKATDVP
jgi:hypothetical protein